MFGNSETVTSQHWTIDELYVWCIFEQLLKKVVTIPYVVWILLSKYWQIERSVKTSRGMGYETGFDQHDTVQFREHHYLLS